MSRARQSLVRPAVLVMVALAVSSGCSQPAPPPAAHGRPAARMDDHEHHEHADHGHSHSFAEAVDELAGTAAAVRDHLAADARDAADDAVHGMGHLLEDLREVVPAAGLDAAVTADVGKAIDDLLECFDKLDTALHAPPGDGASPADIHASIAGRIEAAIQVLQKAGKPPSVTGDGRDDAADIIRDANQAEENR